jgi:hypothetical protein
MCVGKCAFSVANWWPKCGVLREFYWGGAVQVQWIQQDLAIVLQVRSPPPLPTIFLMDGYLTKIRGGKKGQIRSMIRFLQEFSAARVTAGFSDAE